MVSSSSLAALAIAVVLSTGCAERQAADASRGDVRAQPGALTPQGVPPVGPEVKVSAPVRDAVDTLLGGREFIATKEQLDRAGPPAEVAEALRQTSQDGARRMQHRVQSLTLLRFYPEGRTYQVYDRVLGDGAGDPVLRRTTVKAAADAFGKAGLPLMQKALAQDDAPTREAAVRALGTLATPEAKAMLEQHVAIERDPTVAAATKQTLGR